MNIGFIITYIVSIILCIADLTLTYRNQHLLEVIELNPIYHLFNSLIPIVLINIIFFVFMYFWYHHKKIEPTSRYVLLLCLMIIILFRLIAVHNALSWEDNTLSLEEIKQVYTPEVTRQAQKIYAVSLYSSLLFCLVTFLLWRLDHSIERKDKKKEKKI